MYIHMQVQDDFNLLPNGDKTLVGERGITLSGGEFKVALLFCIKK